MRISDWSSDVCSSDLLVGQRRRIGRRGDRRGAEDVQAGRVVGRELARPESRMTALRVPPPDGGRRKRAIGQFGGGPHRIQRRAALALPAEVREIGRAACGEGGCTYVQISGVERTINKKQNK